MAVRNFCSALPQDPSTYEAIVRRRLIRLPMMLQTVQIPETRFEVEIVKSQLLIISD